tara:strand:- start:647 stop:1684 length:1038 start_codon:yes stop_codon:yes gene_type:complete
MSDLRRGAIAWRVLMPILLIAGLIIAYTGYWFYVRGEIIEASEAWITEQADAGYVIRRERLDVGGFPFGFDVVLTAPSVHAPEGEGNWTAHAERLTAHALPYDFSRWVIDVSSPIMMEFDAPVQTTHRIETDRARLSLSGNGDTTQRIGVEIDGLNIRTLQGNPRPAQAVDALRMVAEITDGQTMHVEAAISGLDLNEEYDGSRIRDSFGYHVELARIDFSIDQWPELARDGDLREWSRADGEITIETFQLDWGDLDMSMDGEFGLDDALSPEGRMSLYLLDPALVSARLEESGIITADGARAVQLLAQAAPRDDRGSALPLSLRRGGIYLGPVRIGETGSLAAD